jgi:dedicator of cytokinesis protein 3
VEKTYFTTEEAFPTVLRRSEVVAIEIQEISPIENALNEVEQKTKDLSALYVKYSGLSKTAQVISTNALAMSLNAAVDTPANTGIPSYRLEFFTPDYLAQNPDRDEAVEKLKKAIEDQVCFHTFQLITILSQPPTGPHHRQLS